MAEVILSDQALMGDDRQNKPKNSFLAIVTGNITPNHKANITNAVFVASRETISV
jgi:hypothetical protein